MTSIAGVRNRLQDGVINWQESRFRKAEQRQQHADIRRSRMSCSASLPTYQQNQDWTGGMGISPSGRFQVIEERQAKPRLVSREGIRWDAAVAVLVTVSLLLAAILLADAAGIGISRRAVDRISGKIEIMETRNNRLREELAQSTSNASVHNEAIKMDLISANGARTIRLTAPGNAKLVLSSASMAAENEDLAGRMTSYAGD